ncbi:LOW QUALITY PROTEIN: Ribose-phosphate pyrophosphokinase [Frankliniella fusca]|uniref:Ribose-phosphate pyrophosphokinase n=1 Tax=Frankliniella fusca TaxID=407009 RepID=A0AAE1I401_9NEOP|nr:LOW QUALITY PROTEIN: Ribose-phosphate pyrophosphokinase [Frankliniella fusca]
MHGALGVVKQICSLRLFEPVEWYIGNHADEMNRFVKSEIHPPDFISRLPRSLESFLLYYSLIVVAPYLNDKYPQHWMLFVRAIFVLLTESISENHTLQAETLLHLFVRDLGSLYGDEQCVYNVHQLLHLGLYVRRWGCLWSNAAFNFEDMNGTLSDMIHGSKNEGRELLNQMSPAQGNQILKNKIVNDTIRRSVREKPLPYILSDLEKNIIRQLHFNVEDVNCFGRISVGRETFLSSEYDKNFKRQNSYVEVKHGNRKICWRISVFCECDDSILRIVFVFKSTFFFHRASLTRIGHIIPVENSADIIVCEVGDIIRKFIKVGDYLCCRPNSIERNLASYMFHGASYTTMLRSYTVRNENPDTEPMTEKFRTMMGTDESFQAVV